MPQPLPSTQFRIQFSAIFVSVDSIQYELLTAPLNTPQVNKIKHYLLLTTQFSPAQLAIQQEHKQDQVLISRNELVNENVHTVSYMF
jgi:hypothetical protein